MSSLIGPGHTSDFLEGSNLKFKFDKGGGPPPLRFWPMHTEGHSSIHTNPPPIASLIPYLRCAGDGLAHAAALGFAHASQQACVVRGQTGAAGGFVFWGKKK
jgi:hypothetical protein